MSELEASRRYSNLKYQDLRLKEYLMKHKGMKVILQVSATMKSKKTNEEIRESIRSRRYNITNEDEIPQKYPPANFHY